MANIKDADNRACVLRLRDETGLKDIVIMGLVSKFKDGSRALNIITYTDECDIAGRYKIELDEELVVTDESIGEIIAELIGLGELRSQLAKGWVDIGQNSLSEDDIREWIRITIDKIADTENFRLF